MDELILILPLVIGYILDIVFGDPVSLPHPVVYMGKSISFFEKRLNKGNNITIKGAVISLLLILLSFIVTKFVIELSYEAMTAALRSASDRTVLFGSQSFWEGVDVAGEALSCVVIARLPFAQVKDPIVEARSERIEREGGKSFPDYMLPEAAIRFRQGFGRLIRTQRDRGVVVVTDPRIVTKNYGGIFRKSIPATVHTVTSPGELLQRVADFFA